MIRTKLSSLAIIIFWPLIYVSCTKSTETQDTKPPTPVFSANVGGTTYTGLNNFCIRLSSDNTFNIQSVATYDTSEAAVESHPAFLFHIYADLATGTFTFQPPGVSANEGNYYTGIPGKVYSFQPDPYQPGQTVGGTITITKYDSGRVSGTFTGGVENTDLDINDEMLINGKFSDLPVVSR